MEEESEKIFTKIRKKTEKNLVESKKGRNFALAIGRLAQLV